jgi:LCP family protein required for cell wall assembly
MTANPSPAVAALLSFIFPGLGQIYAGQTRKGVAWAIPMLLFILAVVWLVLGGQNRIVTLVTSDKSQVALLILNFAFFCYHVAAMVDAYAVAQRERVRSFGYPRAAPIALATLVAFAIVLHGLPEVYGLDAHDAFVSIFKPGTASNVIPPPPSFASTTPGPATPSPSATASSSLPPTIIPSSASPSPTGSIAPQPTRSPLPTIDLTGWPSWAQDGRLNLLLVGSDSRSDTGVGAVSLRTDSMILLSVDIQSGKAALFSFPRNLCTATNGSCGDGTRYPDWLQIPLPPEDARNSTGACAYPNGLYTDMLNALWRDAASCPAVFPGSDGISGADCQQQFDCERGWRALVGTLQQISGQSIDGVIAVNLKGFVSLIANLPGGGIWLNIPDALHDDVYFNSQQQPMVVDFQPGCQFLQPEEALAYARSRHQDSDYQRERRQQFVLQQIRKQLDPVGLLPHIPALLQVAQENLFTTLADTDIPYVAQIASRVDADRLYREDFAPSNVAPLGSMAGIRDEVANIFSQPEPQPQPTPSDPGQACPPRT